MLVGVLYAALVSRKYLTKSITTIMSEGADQVGLILLITGAGGAFGKILQATGIADYIAGTLSGFSIPILVLCFVICQIIRCAQGSTTVALTTTAAIMAGTIATSGVSPILCAIATVPVVLVFPCQTIPDSGQSAVSSESPYRIQSEDGVSVVS